MTTSTQARDNHEASGTAASHRAIIAAAVELYPGRTPAELLAKTDGAYADGLAAGEIAGTTLAYFARSACSCG